MVDELDEIVDEDDDEHEDVRRFSIEKLDFLVIDLDESFLESDDEDDEQDDDEDDELSNKLFKNLRLIICK